MLHKLIKKTLAMLTIYSRRKFYITTGFFYCDAITSQQRDWSVVILIMDKHYYENTRTTPTQGYRYTL